MTFGDSTSYRAGVLYKPFAGLLLRSTYATSFKAPDVGSLYLGLADSFPGLSDPCVVTAGSPRATGNNTDTNCNADGVDNTVKQDYAQILAPYGGNPSLKPETSTSITAGFVFSPEFAQGLDFGVDYFNIKIDNFIGAPDPPGHIPATC